MMPQRKAGRSFFLLLFYIAFSFVLNARADSCERIVSLAPSITESVFTLDLGANVVGVTRFCRYPPEASRIARIGGFYDVNVEQIVRLKPTIVFALREHAETIRALGMLGVPVVELDHSRIAGIKRSLSVIGERCGRAAVARDRLDALERRESGVRKLVENRAPLRTLVSVGRSIGAGGASAVYVSGNDGFYMDILTLVGGVNVNTQTTMSIPTVSEEGLRSLAPELIIEIVNADDPHDAESARAFWSRYPDLPAVRSGRVFVESEDYASIPGPRYIELAEAISRQLERHQEKAP